MVIITLPPQAQYAMLATKEEAGMASVAAIAANAAAAAAESTTVKTRWRGRTAQVSLSNGALGNEFFDDCNVKLF